jgi:glycosyltransferase involved in cell wall biosynthesis
MKILNTVEFYHPSKGGAQEVVRQLSERLVKLGHEVVVATTKLPERKENISNGVVIKSFDISGNDVRGYRGDIGAYREFLVNSDFDILMNYAAQQWATDLCLPLLDRIRAKKVFVPCGFSGLFDPAYEAYFKKVADLMPKYDANIFLSNSYRDIEFARKNDISNLYVIPNGCGLDEFGEVPEIDFRRKFGIKPDDFLIIHVGSHTGLKGHRELYEIFKKSNIRDAVLLIIGNPVPGGCQFSCTKKSVFFNFSWQRFKSNKRVIVKDLSRTDTVAAYHAADLFLFPSNIECSPIVLFEAAASRTPFLTTDVGNAHEIVEWTQGGQVLPTKKHVNGYSQADIDQSSAMLSIVWKSSKLREQLASAGYNAWLSKFTWERIAKEFESLFLSLSGQDA